MPILKRFEAVEVNIPNGSTNTRFFFPDQPQLRSAMIQAIQLYTPGTLSATPNTGSTMVTEADLKKSFLTLYSGDLQLIYNAPLFASLTKSYISLSSAAGTTNCSYAFGVYYSL